MESTGGEITVVLESINKYYIFGKDGGKEMAEKLGVPLLGQIPLVQSIREAGDVGRPAALQQDTMVSAAFSDFAKKTAQQISILNSNHQVPA